jgi:hypothetical protein
MPWWIALNLGMGRSGFFGGDRHIFFADGTI